MLSTWLRLQAEQNPSVLFSLIFSLNKRNTQPAYPVCTEWRLLFMHFIWTLATVPRSVPSVQVMMRWVLTMDRGFSKEKFQVKGKIMREEWGDDLQQRSDSPLDEGQTVVRRCIMLEKLDLIIAIVKCSCKESSFYAREVIWSHFFTSMDHYFERQFI